MAEWLNLGRPACVFNKDTHKEFLAHAQEDKVARRAHRVKLEKTAIGKELIESQLPLDGRRDVEADASESD